MSTSARLWFTRSRSALPLSSLPHRICCGLCSPHFKPACNEQRETGLPCLSSVCPKCPFHTTYLDAPFYALLASIMKSVIPKCCNSPAFLLCLLLFGRISLALVLSPMPTQPAIYRRQAADENGELYVSVERQQLIISTVKTVDQSGSEVGSAEDNVEYDSST